MKSFYANVMLLVCLMTLVEGLQQTLPSTTGKFFYAEIKSDMTSDYDQDVMYLRV